MRERRAAVLAATAIVIVIRLILVMWQIRMRDEMHRRFGNLGHAGRNRKQEGDRDEKSHALLALLCGDGGVKRRPVGREVYSRSSGCPCRFRAISRMVASLMHRWR